MTHNTSAHKKEKRLHNTKNNNPTADTKNKPIVARDRDSPTCKWLEEYRDCFDGRIQPVTQMFLDRISEQVIQYAKTTEDVMRVNYFFAMKHIPLDTVGNWRKKYDDFATSYNLAKAILAMRKENKFLNSAIVMGTMGRDDDEYDKWLTKQAEQKLVLQRELEEEEGEQKIIVEVRDIKR